MLEQNVEGYRSFYPDYPDVVSVEDMSHMLNICKVNAYELVKTGQVHGVKIGRIYRIPKKAIYQYLEKQA